MNLFRVPDSLSPVASSRYLVDIDVNMYNQSSMPPLFGESSLQLENSQNSMLHHSFVEEIKSSGPELERLARESGLMTDKGFIPTLLSVPPPAAATKEEESDFHEESSASYTSPVKRGRGKVKAQNSSASKRSKSRRSKSGGSSQSSQSEKAQTKGLRHFSLAVCTKVREKGVTTYNEVADEVRKKLLLSSIWFLLRGGLRFFLFLSFLSWSRILMMTRAEKTTRRIFGEGFFLCSLSSLSLVSVSQMLCSECTTR